MYIKECKLVIKLQYYYYLYFIFWIVVRLFELKHLNKYNILNKK